MALPGDGLATRGAPEFEALRQALRELATALDAARGKELEAERLRAFREVARRVAHEIKNPLTSMRIAVDQLGRSGGPAGGRGTGGGGVGRGTAPRGGGGQGGVARGRAPPGAG